MEKKISMKQAWIINDILWEIQESKKYEGEDLEVLESLKEIFSWTNVKSWDCRKGQETMSMTDFRSQMYKWEKTAKLGDTLLLTHNGVVVLTVIKGD